MTFVSDEKGVVTQAVLVAGFAKSKPLKQTVGSRILLGAAT